MIKDPEYYGRVKARLLAGDSLDLDRKYAILDSLFEEARALGRFGDDTLLLGLNDTIQLAAALHAPLPGSSR